MLCHGIEILEHIKYSFHQMQMFLFIIEELVTADGVRGSHIKKLIIDRHTTFNSANIVLDMYVLIILIQTKML